MFRRGRERARAGAVTGWSRRTPIRRVITGGWGPERVGPDTLGAPARRTATGAVTRGWTRERRRSRAAGVVVVRYSDPVRGNG
ncbi:hypothetical protein GCM10009818_18260 [Nakamurella flavida]